MVEKMLTVDDLEEGSIVTSTLTKDARVVRRIEHRYGRPWTIIYTGKSQEEYQASVGAFNAWLKRERAASPGKVKKVAAVELDALKEESKDGVDGKADDSAGDRPAEGGASIDNA